jgi:hypothetical protein
VLPCFNRYRPPLIGDNEEVDRAYWKHILYGEQIYGADVSGSLMDSDLKVNTFFTYVTPCKIDVDLQSCLKNHRQQKLLN